MHGIVFSELKRYVDEKLGINAWDGLLQKAGLEGKMYMPIQQYPDSEIVSLVSSASVLTGSTRAAILEDFGTFITPSLIQMYGHLLERDWKSLDVIEHTEGTVHTVVRLKNPGASPPHLKSRRVSPNEVVLLYDSPRQMCALAIGIGKGLGLHYRENIAINETQCMHRGAPFCEIHFHTHSTPA